MKHLFGAALILCSIHYSCGQALTAEQILENSIAFHDPENQWPMFRQQLYFTTDMPDGSKRSSNVVIDNTKGYFEYHAPDQNLSFGIALDSCFMIKGEPQDCARIQRTRNYYVYLWGLPMKLKDEGTILAGSVSRETIKGTEYLVIKVTYPEDVWYYYINPQTFRMEAYKFYKDEPNQKGEIIYLDQLMEVQSVKMPVSRAWYRTENDEYLATDNLIRTESLK